MTTNKVLNTIVISLFALMLFVCALGIATVRVASTVTAAALPIATQESEVTASFNEALVYDEYYEDYEGEASDYGVYTKISWSFNETSLSPLVRQIARIVNADCYYYDAWVHESNKVWELTCYQR